MLTTGIVGFGKRSNKDDRERGRVAYDQLRQGWWPLRVIDMPPDSRRSPAHDDAYPPAPDDAALEEMLAGIHIPAVTDAPTEPMLTTETLRPQQVNGNKSESGISVEPEALGKESDFEGYKKSEPTSSETSNGSCKKSEGPADKKSDASLTETCGSETSATAAALPKRRSTVALGQLPPWERLDKERKARVYQYLLDRLGESHPFTLNFDHALIARAWKTKKTPSTWINERITHALRPIEEKIGSRIPFWFHLEVSRNDVYHVHGVLGIGDDLRREVEAALRRVAGGFSRGAGRYFVHIGDFDPDKQYGGFHGSLGWAAYAVKDLPRTVRRGDVGAPLVCRRELNQRAHKLYNVLRAYQARKGVL